MEDEKQPRSSLVRDTVEIEAAMSLYEDALDESDVELERVCNEALNHIKKQRKRKHSRRRKPFLVPQTMTAPLLRSGSQALPTSSSEHSSIERIYCDDKGQRRSRSRPANREEKQREQKSASGASSGSQSGEWKLVNIAEANSYSVLVQLNQQLQLISRQLYAMETTNTLQLRLMYRIVNETIKRRKRSWLSAIISSIPVPFFIFLVIWPFFVAWLRRLYISSRRKMAINLYRYL